MNQSPAEYWQNNKQLEHITPPGEEFPEIGLRDALLQACIGNVFEFGCGYGRLAQFFSHQRYTGYDINRHAIEKARHNLPKHIFGNEWVDADTFLAYTVLLHIPDNEIEFVLNHAKRKYSRIVIGEMMGREWRRPGNPPVFNRDQQDYVDLIGWKHHVIKIKYPRYGCDLDLMVFDLD